MKVNTSFIKERSWFEKLVRCLRRRKEIKDGRMVRYTAAVTNDTSDREENRNVDARYN